MTGNITISNSVSIDSPKLSISQATSSGIKELEKIKFKSITDPFVAALKMAIENDGKIDKQELKHLKRLEKSTSQSTKSSSRKRRRRKRNRDFFSFRFRFHSPFSFSFFVNKPKRRKRKVKLELAQKPEFKLNQNLREAFKIAILDGKVNKSEITNLKQLF